MILKRRWEVSGQIPPPVERRQGRVVFWEDSIESSIAQPVKTAPSRWVVLERLGSVTVINDVGNDVLAGLDDVQSFQGDRHRNRIGGNWIGKEICDATGPASHLTAILRNRSLPITLLVAVGKQSLG